MDRMTPAATGTVIRYLGSLFPRWKTTPELVSLWSEVLRRYEEPVVRRVIAEHRQTRRGDDPSLADVREALADARPEPLALPSRVAEWKGDTNDVGGWLAYFWGTDEGRRELNEMPDAAVRGLDWMREIWGIDENGRRVPPEVKQAWKQRRMQQLRKVTGSDEPMR